MTGSQGFRMTGSEGLTMTEKRNHKCRKRRYDNRRENAMGCGAITYPN